MAINIDDKGNVDGPGGDFEFSHIRDDSSPGAGNGTPVNTLVYGDFHQFFAKLIDLVSIAYNDLPENLGNDYQYIDALIANIRATSASTTEKGTVERATQTEVDTGTDTTRHITPSLLKAAKTVLGVDGSVKLRTKVLEIGDWDMDASGSASVTHGLTRDNIRSVTVLIIPDDGVVWSFLGGIVTGIATNRDGFRITSTIVDCRRLTGGDFDSSLYNSTSFNRGWVTIVYEV